MAMAVLLRSKGKSVLSQRSWFRHYLLVVSGFSVFAAWCQAITMQGDLSSPERFQPNFSIYYLCIHGIFYHQNPVAFTPSISALSLAVTFSNFRSTSDALYPVAMLQSFLV
jgi:hypothetical protein